MPELPEVETIKRELAPLVEGRRITGVVLDWPKAVRRPSAEEFRRAIPGRKVVTLDRHGKYLVFHLDDGRSLVVHLKMTGSLIMLPVSEPLPRYARTVFELDGHGRLVFIDPRKFGSLWLLEAGGPFPARLGPEPLDKDFTGKRFYELIHRRKTPIKTLLYDQAVMAGIGNMYADEALFEARIDPRRGADDLTQEEAWRLHRAIGRVLRKGIRNLGASIANYQLPDGSKGRAHLEFNVAHRKGLPCPRCGTPIARITLRGRGTFFCPKCQR